MNNIKATIKPKYNYPCTIKSEMQVIYGRINVGSAPSPAPVSGGYILSTTETQALTVQQVEGSE